METQKKPGSGNLVIQLKPWQWGILILPVVGVGGFLLGAASWQIHRWQLSWIWGVIIFVFVGWRWLLARWTRPLDPSVLEELTPVNPVLPPADPLTETQLEDLQAQLQTLLLSARQDAPPWEDWPQFWQRCQQVVTLVAQTYYPDVKYPLLNIYVPDAYGLIRGTVDEMDRWMATLSPTLGQVSVGQVYQSYEVYQTLEPSLRKLWQVWNWSQWVLNPFAAAARQLSQSRSDQANQQLLVNLSQQLRETTLRTLCRQAIALYSRTTQAPEFAETPPALIKAKSQSLQTVLAQSQPPEIVAQQPLQLLLVGRTGAGKSSLINSLFQQSLAVTDLLPSTTDLQEYQWQTPDGETLCLWDSPGYEQGQRQDFRDRVLHYAQRADGIVLLNPALDPALQMDGDFLQDLETQGEENPRPVILLVTQVDRLRPVREWSPPYDWRQGTQPKEQAIRDAIQYRYDQLGAYCTQILPLVNGDENGLRPCWGLEDFCLALLDTLSPAKQQRLARFFRQLEIRSLAAAQIIDRYALQMTTTQGVTALLKSPVLEFISRLATGSPALAYLLAEQIPLEQLPLVLGKLQLAYELFTIVGEDSPLEFDLLALWPVLLDHPVSPDRNAWAFGHAVLEYWTQGLTPEQLRSRFQYYCGQFPNP